MELDSKTNTCPKCHFQNTPEAIVCERCDTPLKPSTMPVPDMIDASSLTDDGENAAEAKQKERGIALWVRSHARPLLISGGAILGRQIGEENNQTLIDLTDYNGYKLGVSRRHAQIDCTGQGCLLIDLGSSNGTWVNGLRLQPYQPTVLRSGDRIYLARLEIIVGPISDEALRRARHIPDGIEPDDDFDGIPSDIKTDSLAPGQQKVTVPIESDADAGSSANRGIKATMLPAHKGNDEPAESADQSTNAKKVDPWYTATDKPSDID